MLPMGHPDHEYQPWSEVRRAKASAAQRARLGIPSGYRRLFGAHVADNESFVEVRRRALAYYNRTNAAVVAVMMPAIVAQVARGDAASITYVPKLRRRPSPWTRAVRPLQPTKPAELPTEKWVIVSLSSETPHYWHSDRRRGGWFHTNYSALEFESYSAAEAYARKRFPKYLGALPVRLA